jgi:hypothetical protein
VFKKIIHIKIKTKIMTKLKPCQKNKKHFFNLKVRVIKAPLVDSSILKQVLLERQRALVL